MKKKKNKLPNDKQTKEKLRSLARHARREDMLSSGAYDGRYKPKVVEDKKHKKPKHKKKLFE